MLPQIEASTTRKWGILMWELQEAIDYRLNEGKDDKNFGEYALHLAKRIRKEKRRIDNMKQN